MMANPNDGVVMRSMYRHGFRTPLRTFHQTFSSFCQWCANVRTPTNGEDKGLVCPHCDRLPRDVPAGEQ